MMKKRSLAEAPMSSGRMEDFGSRLPSYPTLPSSPPKSGQQQHLTELVSPPTDSTPHVPTSPAAAGPYGGSLHHNNPIPSEWGTAGSSGSAAWMDMEPKWGPFTTPDAMQLHTQPKGETPPFHFSSDPSQWLTSSSSNSLPSNVATPTGIPIYATVKKPSNSPSMQHPNSARQRTTSGSPFTAPVTTTGLNLLPGQPYAPSPSTATSTQALKIKHLEELCGKLSWEKSEMTEEFGRQRMSFMNQMAKCDGELSLCRHTAEKYTKEVQELSEVLLRKDEELLNVTIAAGITEATLRERFDADRVKYEEEIASLRKIVSVQSQDTNQVMQQDREVWQQQNAALHEELEQLHKERLSLSSQQQQQQQQQQQEQQQEQEEGQEEETSPLQQQAAKSPSPTLTAEESSLEISMNKAAEDTKLLRAVVLPLEEEIQSLKQRLIEAESRLAEQQAQKAGSALIDLEMPLSVGDLDRSHDLTSPTSSDVRELQNHLRLARAACSDLEMHTSQLKMQKNILHDEIKSLSEQLTRVSTNYEVEKLNCNELKETWKLANDHFIVSQDKLKQEIYRLHQKLERGEAISPMREIEIGAFPSPNMVVRTPAQEDGGAAAEDIAPARTHRRSWSTDEVSETIGLATPTLQRLKSASWSSIHKSWETTPEDTEVLSKRAKDLEDELLKVREDLVYQRRVSANYEKQLPRVQEQMTKDLDEKELAIEKLKLKKDKFEAHVMRQRQQYEKLCRQIEDLKEEMRTKIENFQSNERDLKSQLRILRDKFTEIKHDTQREIAKMSEDRRDVCQQLERSREEYDYMKAIQSSCVTDYQAQLADLKQTSEETELKLNKTMAQSNTTRDQLRQVRDMLNAERSSKEKIHSSLASHLEVARRKIEELTPLVSKLETEKNAKEEALLAKATTERKSREFITGQRELLEKLNKEKDKAEGHVQELQAQVASLKFKLNHTEQTQKDFVELSQSLQMKLAVMEEDIQKNQEQVSFSSPAPST